MSDLPLPTTTLAQQTVRLVPSQFPPVGVFDTVATAEDAIAAMRLEGLTNDRLTVPLARAGLLPREEWLVGTPGATTVMAAFLHAAPDGGRFTSGALGAWYAALERPTAIAETVYHQTRRIAASTALAFRARITMREWRSGVRGALVDLRGLRAAHPDWYAPEDYTTSQRFGEAQRAAGETGLVYESVRRAGGSCVVVYRPRAVTRVQQGRHYEYVWSGDPEPMVFERTVVR
ncbi:MAG: RES family NAD+ phosphorylase [Gemmatimonadaceae bacterium]|nr:RES family NAD+ phosphorylase [Gemmatimonadaceae bacterium]